jgi:type I restriction enzyme, S subunit
MKLLSLLKELSLHPKNAEELKGLILQLAIQGKLTSNWRLKNPEVEHASVLLDKVEEKKAILIQEKKIRNVKSVPIDNELRSIPDTWAWARMIDYLDVRDGTHDSPKYVSDGFPLVTSKNLYTKKLDITNVKYISKKDHDEISKRSKVDRNDILFAMIGTIGNPVIVDIEPNFSIKNVALIKYYEDGLCEPNYILNFLENATNEFKAESDGAVQSFVSLKKLRLKEIPIPPLEEQKAIAEVVNALFKEVEALENLTKDRISLKEDFVTSALRRLTDTDNTTQEWNYLQQHFSSFFTEKKNIKSLRETISQLAVQGKLTAKWREENPSVENASELLKRIETEKQQLIAEKKIKKEKKTPLIEDEDKPYDLPRNWAWCRFQNIITDLKGGGTPSKANPFYWNGKLPWASVKDLKDFRYLEKTRDFISEEGLDNSSANLIPSNSLIICTRMGLGKIAINKIPVTINQDLKAVTLSRFANIEFIYDQYKTISIIGSGMTVAGIKQEELLAFLFALPPIEEQQAIVEKVNSLMALCDELEQEIDNRQTQIEQLMQRCLKEVFEQ